MQLVVPSPSTLPRHWFSVSGRTGFLFVQFLGGLNTLSPGDEKIGKMTNTIGALFGYLLFDSNKQQELGVSAGSERHLARASLPVELRIHCVKLRTLEKCNSSSSVLFLL